MAGSVGINTFPAETLLQPGSNRWLPLVNELHLCLVLEAGALQFAVLRDRQLVKPHNFAVLPAIQFASWVIFEPDQGEVIARTTPAATYEATHALVIIGTSCLSNGLPLDSSPAV